MSALRVPGPDGHTRLIDQGPAVGRIANSFNGSLVQGRSGDANGAAHAEAKKRARDAAREAKEAGR